MHLLPTQDEVVRVLRETGALRDGHFEYTNGLHSNEYLQVPLAMRYYQHARMLSVGLSRLLRENAEIRAIIPELSIVAPANAGLPVAFGVCEALRARQVYWARTRGRRSRCASASSWSSTRANRWCWWTISCAPAASCARCRNCSNRAARAWWRWLSSSTSLPPTRAISASCRSIIWPGSMPATMPTPRIAISAKKAWRRCRRCGYRGRS